MQGVQARCSSLPEPGISARFGEHDASRQSIVFGPHRLILITCSQPGLVA